MATVQKKRGWETYNRDMNDGAVEVDDEYGISQVNDDEKMNKGDNIKKIEIEMVNNKEGRIGEGTGEDMEEK